MKGQRKVDKDMKHNHHRRHRHSNQGSDNISSQNGIAVVVVAPTTTPFIVSWIHTIAIMGDSMFAVIASFVILLFAMMIAIWQQQQHPTEGYHRNNDTTTLPMMNNNKNNIAPYDSMNRASSSSSSTMTSKEVNTNHTKYSYTTYESLGPKPIMKSPTIYHLNISHRNLDNDDKNHNNNNISIYDYISHDMYMDYKNDGVVCFRGLLSNQLLQSLDDLTVPLISKNVQQRPTSGGTQFHTLIHSPIFHPYYHHHNTTTTTTTNTMMMYNDNRSTLQPPPSISISSPFINVALFSYIPMVASLLLQSQYNNSRHTKHESIRQNDNDDDDILRVIRDIFLAKDDDTHICGWHVDDMGFWPAMPTNNYDNHTTTNNNNNIGINAWIALDDMEMIEMTGGIAFAIQSHIAPWNDMAYYYTGIPMNDTFPIPYGYQNVSHMFQTRTGYGTCTIQSSLPHIYQRLEETKRIYPVKRGDVIFHTRYLFHRTVPIQHHRKKKYNTMIMDHDHTIQQQQQQNTYRRYSIRYGYGSTTIIPPGYGTELSILYNASYGGQSASSICTNSKLPWYPQAYPPMNNTELYVFEQQYHHLQNHILPNTIQQQKLRKQEIHKYMQQQQQQQQFAAR